MGPTSPPYPGQTAIADPLTEADIRRIVADEIAKALAVHRSLG